MIVSCGVCLQHQNTTKHKRILSHIIVTVKVILLPTQLMVGKCFPVNDILLWVGGVRFTLHHIQFFSPIAPPLFYCLSHECFDV